MATGKKIIKKTSQTKNKVFCWKIIFNVLSNVNCFRIFRCLSKRRELSSQDIVNILNISGPAVNKHLEKLEANGFVAKEKIGRTFYYSLNSKNQSAVATRLTFFRS